jgi:hypothetical protein
MARAFGSASAFHLFQARTDGGIVVGGSAEDFPGELPLGIEGEFAARRAQLLQNRGVVFRRGHHGDILVVLGGGAQHGGPADIDILDELRQRRAGLGGHFLETVEVDHHHVDGCYAVSLNGRHVLRVVAHGEDAAGDSGVQGLDAAVQHLRESGDVADVGDGDACVAKQASRAAGRNEFGAHGGEGGGEFDDAGLIGDAEQYAGDLCHLLAR